MPEMPSLDIAGLTELMSIVLVSLAVFWGINKAIHTAKR
jgi:hypothetical protein